MALIAAVPLAAQSNPAPPKEGTVAEALDPVDEKRKTGSARDEDILVTGQRYAGRKVSIGKSEQSVREIPQSISVITREQLDDRNFTKLEDALKQTTGITVTRLDGGGNFNSISSRGFDIGAIQLDGVPIPQGANYATALDAAIYERFEVLRGPAGLLQGGGEPGGAINLVRKRALGTLGIGMTAQLGSFDFRRADVDLTGPLMSSGALRARVVGVIDRRDSHVVTVSNDKWLGYGTLELDITPKTTLSAGYTRQEVRAGYDRGLPTYPDGRLVDMPVSSAVIIRGTRQDLDTEDAFVELEHRLDNGGQIKFSARDVVRTLFYRYASSNSAIDATGNVVLQDGDVKTESKDRLYDVSYNNPISLFGHNGQILLGASRNRNDSYAANVAGPNLRFNVFAPNYDIAFPVVILPDYISVTEREETAVYGQLQFAATERLKLIAGGRVSWAEVRTVRLLDDAVTARSKPGRQFIPQAALMYDIGRVLTAYASYGETFVVQTQLTAVGGLLPPRTSSQIEAGLKGEFFEQRMQAHAAVFRIDDKGRAIADPDNINASLPGGEVRSQGFELEASGQISPGWDVLAGYAYTDTEYVKAPVGQQGQVFSAFTPKHSVSAFTRYDFQGGVLDGVSIGGGASYRSKFFAQSGNIRIVTGNYAILNAQLGYKINEHISLNMTVDNLLDKKYYEKVSSPARQNFYGEPRRVALAARARF